MKRLVLFYFLGLLFWGGVAAMVVNTFPTLGIAALFLLLGYTVVFWVSIALCQVAR